MQNTTVYVLMRCERGWPEDQFPEVEAVAFSVDKIYEYMKTEIPDAKMEDYDDRGVEWNDEHYNYWIEEHTPLD